MAWFLLPIFVLQCKGFFFHPELIPFPPATQLTSFSPCLWCLVFFYYWLLAPVITRLCPAPSYNTSFHAAPSASPDPYYVNALILLFSSIHWLVWAKLNGPGVCLLFGQQWHRPLLFPFFFVTCWVCIAPFLAPRTEFFQSPPPQLIPTFIPFNVPQYLISFFHRAGCWELEFTLPPFGNPHYVNPACGSSTPFCFFSFLPQVPFPRHPPYNPREYAHSGPWLNSISYYLSPPL